MFVRILFHTLSDEDAEILEQSDASEKPKASQPLQGPADPQEAEATLNALKHGSRVELKIRNLYVVFFRDGQSQRLTYGPQSHA